MCRNLIPLLNIVSQYYQLENMLRDRLTVEILDSHIKPRLMELIQNDAYKYSIALQTSRGLEAASNIIKKERLQIQKDC